MMTTIDPYDLVAPAFSIGVILGMLFTISVGYVYEKSSQGIMFVKIKDWFSSSIGAIVKWIDPWNEW